jgi:hypothetical protein
MDVRFDFLPLRNMSPLVDMFDKDFARNTPDRPVLNVRRRSEEILIAAIAGEVNLILLCIKASGKKKGTGDKRKRNPFSDKKDTLPRIHEISFKTG